MNKIGILIPCYNVAASIGDVLDGFSDDTLDAIDEILVIDNCSQDETLNILKKMQADHGKLSKRLVVVKNSTNYGLGGSQKIAYDYFLKNGFLHFMIIHGDNQGDGERIARNFLKYLKESPSVDVIIASRFAKDSDTSQYNRMRVIGNLLFNFLTFLFTGHHMSDSGAAIVFIRTDVLKQIPYQQLTNSFQFNSLLNILFYNLKDLHIIEIPLVWKDSKDKSNITPFNYCWTLLKILMNYCWNKNFLRKQGWQMFHQQSQQMETAYSIIHPAQ